VQGFLSRDRISRKNILNPQDFAERFVQAVQIAEPFRAVTYKGIMNGSTQLCLLQAMTFVPSKPGFMPMLQNQVSTPAYLTLKSKMVFHILARDLRELWWTNYFTSFS
jgi:hypothetical protein